MRVPELENETRNIIVQAVEQIFQKSIEKVEGVGNRLVNVADDLNDDWMI